MRSVGVREFRDNATQLIASGETLVVEKRGEPVGFFVPVAAKDRCAQAAAMKRLGEVVQGVLDKTGLSEDEFVAEFTDARFAGNSDS